MSAHFSPRMGTGPAAVRRAFQSRQHNAAERLEPRTLFAAGDVDPSFALGGSVFVDVSPVANDTEGDQGARAVEVTNGRVVMAGFVDPGGAAPSRVALVVLNLQGNRVTSFSGDGVE